MTNVSSNYLGVGVYAKGDEPGTLRAEWATNQQKDSFVGHGHATGGPADGFAGTYSIIYYDEDGAAAEPFDVVIEAAGDTYRVTWQRAGETLLVGVGIETAGKLVFGWMPVHQLDPV